ncbi:MAG: hypothetical protein QOH24_258 [Verrucomicrobiota bacterium]
MTIVTLIHSAFRIETRSPPGFTRYCPRSFTFYVARPTRSIPQSAIRNQKSLAASN